MGKQNKQRRARRKKQRDQQRRARPVGRDQQRAGPAEHGPLPPPRREPPPPTTEALVDAAAWTSGDPSAHARVLLELAARADALAVLDRRLAEGVAEAWRRGWTPADLAHVAGRRGDPVQRSLMVCLAHADTQRRRERGERLDPRWVAQVEALATGQTRIAPPLDTRIALLGLLVRLPDQPATLPAPGSAVGASAGGGLDPRVLERVRALLAKAESTEFDEEAEALTTKAQELIARHAIDDALLQRPDDVGAPSVRRVHLDDPYVEAKAVLLQHIAAANSCRGVYAPDLGWVTLFGYDSALDAVELLHASLLAQATAAMVRQGSRRDATGRSRTRSFRRSFLLGFSQRIGERLRAAAAGQGTEDERRRALPVLASRAERVEEAAAAAFPGMVNKTFGIGHAGGFTAGRVAADLAVLDATRGPLRGAV